MSRYNQKYRVELTEEERKRIESVLRNKDITRTIKCRAQVLKLKNAGKLTQEQIAKQVGVCLSTVNLAIRKYHEEGLDSVLHFNHNSASDDAKRKVDSAEEARIVALACSAPPAGHSRWTLKLLAKHAAKFLNKPVGATTIGVILRRHSLKPHRCKYWCRAPGPDDDPEKRRQWGEAMDSILDVYARPYDPDNPSICLDEKTLQLLDEVREPLEAVPGQILRVDPEYRRKGTAALFVITEPATGRCAVSTRAHRTAGDFAEVLAYICDVMYPDAGTITIVLDNLNTHKLSSLYRRFSEAKADRIAARLSLVHTPVHGSWLNLAENQISVIARQCLTRRIADLKLLRTKMRVWVRTRNSSPKPVRWRFSKVQARQKLPQMYPDITAA